MGGDSGGNDCVHVIDVRPVRDHAERILTLVDLRDDTDVIVHDEHGNVCQFTYQEWNAFRLKMADGTFDHIGDVPSPEDIVPIATDAMGRPIQWAQNVPGIDPSAAARLDALPDVSGTMTFESGAEGRERFARATDGLPDSFDQPPGRRAGIGMGVHPDAIIDGYGFAPERDR